MTAKPGNRQSVTQLNALRREAVQLRLDGHTLQDTAARIGLSAPTIIAAVKAYKLGGWPAVDVGARGRPKLDGGTVNLEHIKQALLTGTTQNDARPTALWSQESVAAWLHQHQGVNVSQSTVNKWLRQWSLAPDSRYRRQQAGTDGPPSALSWLTEHQRFARRARRRGTPVYWIASRQIDARHHQLYAHDLRGHAQWCLTEGAPDSMAYLRFLQALQQQHAPAGVALVLPGAHLVRDAQLAHWLERSATEFLIIGQASDRPLHSTPTVITMSSSSETPKATRPEAHEKTQTLTHLQRLEAESIQIMREVVAEAENPVMLYSIGKDSAVMLHLARKAFFPAVPPFPLLHVDTTWKFKAMYEFRDSIVKQYGMELLTHINPEGLAQKVNPFTHGSALHTDIMKTQGLKQALDEHRFDIAFGGARRDEEKSRAKERVFSFRSAQHRWDAKNQRPELWQLYNARKLPNESIRVFPLSNWTELDIWQYIHREDIPIVPLYFAGERPVVMRDGTMIMVDDERMPLHKGEVPEMRSVRFRTLGCYPLTGAVDSTANTLEGIIQEMLLTRTSERQGRMIDHDSSASMEKKKQEGYF